MSQPYYPQQQQHPQQQPLPQAQIINVIQTENHPQGQTYEHYKSKSSTILGALQIILAFLCVIFTAVGIGVQHERSDLFHDNTNYAFHAGTGIWASVFFFISGGLALGAASTKSKCLVISTLIMSIISAVFGMIIMIWASIMVAIENDTRYNERNYGWDYYWGQTSYTTWESEDKASYAMSVMILIMSFALIFMAIWTSALGCAACCCGPSPGRPVGQRSQIVQPVVYYGQPGTFMTTSSQHVTVATEGYHQPMHAQQPPPYTNSQPTYIMQQGPAPVHMPHNVAWPPQGTSTHAPATASATHPAATKPDKFPLVD